MVRQDKSNVIENALKPTDKKAFTFDRLSMGFKRDDPFEKKAKDDVWMIKGDKLMKNKKYKE